MKVYCDVVQLYRNIEAVHAFAAECEVTAAFMMKPMLDCKVMRDALRNQVVYTTAEHPQWTNIYATDGVHVVDGLDTREGITMQEAEKVEQKDVAIVNAYCCMNEWTNLKDVNAMYWGLKDAGFKKVSMGGTVLMHQDVVIADELRIGEAMLTGTLAGTRVEPFAGMANPWYVHLPVWKRNKHGAVIRKGFCELAGFTDADVLCNNTEMMVVDTQQKSRFVMLQPDYYSLVRMGHNGMLADVEVI